MDEANRDLWRRLEAFELDDASASLTFTRRLARENGWEHPFACRVVEEYKRFVFLAMTAGRQVTPSDEVDQAWHLHLTYTRSYWGELCGDVLGRPLHHGPTQGGQQEGERFEDQYERTLASYREAFGEEPPADIWPPSEVRFGEAADFVRVNRQRLWLLPKPWRVNDRRPLVLAGAWVAVIPPVAAGAAWNPLDFDGPQFLTLYGMAFLLSIAGAFLCRSAMRVKDARVASEPLGDNPIEIGALRGGWTGAFHAALAGLLRSGEITTSTKGWLKKTYHFSANRGPSAADGPVEQALLTAASNENGVELSTLGLAARPPALKVEESLAARGLVETAASFQPARLAPVLLVGCIFTFGAAKFMVGIGRDKPVGILLFFLLVTAVCLVAFWRKPHQTLAGKQQLKRIKKQKDRLRRNAKSPSEDFDGSDAAMAVALFGVTACDDPSIRHLQTAAHATPSDSGGCSSSDSGGGGGCGGGGCGGCGG